MDIPQSLRDRWAKAVQAAKEYHAAGGDPIEELERVLEQAAPDAVAWQEILDEPYG